MAIQNFRVAGFVLGLAIKAPVHTVSAVNIPTLSGTGQNIGGYIVSAGDRVLLTAQSNPIDNGIYSVRVTAWIRDGDADGNRDFVGGTLVPVWIQANTNITLYRLEGDPDAKTIGVDPLVFSVYYDPSAAGGGDDLQAVTTVGNTTDQGIDILNDALFRIGDLGNVDTLTVSINSTIQAPNKAVEFDASATIFGFNFNEDINVDSGNIHISNATGRLAFYRIGDAVSSYIGGDANQAINYVAVGGSAMHNFQGAPVNVDDEELQQAEMADFSIKQQTIAANGGAVVLDYELGQSVWLIVNQDIPSFTFQNLPASGVLAQFEIEVLMNGPQRTITWNAAIEWPNAGTALPDPAAGGGLALVNLRTRDAGGTWLGTYAEDFQ